MGYDVIVVGAGSAGATLAGRLAEDPKLSVLVLEEGPDFSTVDKFPEELTTGYGSLMGTGTPFLWTCPASYSDAAGEGGIFFRGRVVGGGSTINGGVFPRGLPEDFDHWASLGNDLWSYQEVLPYFRRLERDLDFGGDFHGKDGPITVRRVARENLLPAGKAFLEACVSKGFPFCPDVNAPDATGVGMFAVNDDKGLRVNTAVAYLNPNRHRLNLTVSGGVTVRKVLFEGNRTMGVEVESGGETFRVEGREIVLSAGAIASPFLLLHSGVGPADQLEALGIPVVNDLPGVGANLTNHPSINLWFHNKKDLPRENVPNQIFLRYTAEGFNTTNDMTITHEAQPVMLEGVSHFRFTVTLEWEESRGSMGLTSPDQAVPPAIRFRYFDRPGDLERMREGVRLGVALGQEPALREVLGERSIPTDEVLASAEALDGWLRAEIYSYQHSSGTCKMGPGSDAMAVVDQRCRVHGLDGLRVVDASIMPQVVRANTNATCIMIGERVVDWVREGDAS
jgi:choline dehydrogenase